MSQKKSYMNNESILAEGFFSKLSKMLGLSSKEEKTLKKDKKLKSALKDYNNSWKKLEKKVQQQTGNKSFKLPHQKFKLTDFL
tara:strand:- start:277 stop:525 length:249 start_codon:yes stop_codon:yes gene_type:complete